MDLIKVSLNFPDWISQIEWLIPPLDLGLVGNQYCQCLNLNRYLPFSELTSAVTYACRPHDHYLLYPPLSLRDTTLNR